MEVETKANIDYNLFSSYDLRGIELNNRIVMAPMTRNRAIDNVPNDLMATYYSQRAGAGLIITEGTSPSINGLGYPRMPGIITDEQVDGWKEVTHQVHAMGGKIYCQLMHSGRVGHPKNLSKDAELIGPSSLELKHTKMYVDGLGELEIPLCREMSKMDIQNAIYEFVKAAKNALDAGFDGIEVHAANGYLINQFINKKSNRRQDEYGGSIENRTRFCLEIVEAIVEEIGSDRIGVRISPYTKMNDLDIYDDIDDTYKYLVTQLNRLNVGYIHLLDHSSMGLPAVPESLKSQIRILYNGTLILCGGYDKERAERDIVHDRADLIAFGRPFIANPDLVGRFTEEARLQIPNDKYFYTAGEQGYIDYPYLKKIIQ